ncbi:hypothetical protein HDU98_007965 [Podochytrium sp. JEL0797]|nr:hypothetical protein HDU98_007965 [Podochytrium sp. JEL0797]
MNASATPELTTQCILAIASPHPQDRSAAFQQMGALLFSQSSFAFQRQTLSKTVLPHSGVASAACGAFVHGCEDEFEAVREAAVGAIGQTAIQSLEFATIALDSLVDMFNDEMQLVRLTSITWLKRIALQFLMHLNQNQLLTMLLALDDVNPEMRHVGYEIMGIFRVKTAESIETQISHLNRNMKRFPKDRILIFKCFRDIGANHPRLIDGLKDVLLKLDRRFLPKEIDLDNLAHIANLIMIFNAGFSDPTVLQSIPDYAFKQAVFLKAKYPDCFPSMETNSIQTTALPSETDFLRDSLASIHEDVTDLVAARRYSDALSVMTQFAREIQQICLLKPDFDFAALVKEYTDMTILIIQVTDFKMPHLHLPAFTIIHSFKGTVTASVEPGLPLTLDCVHYVPVPVHFEGKLEHGHGFGDVLAIVVELSNQKKIVVPIDRAVLKSSESAGTLSFAFSKALILGDTSFIKCTVVPGYVVPLKDADRFWVLEGCTDSCASVSLTSGGGGGTIVRAWYAL